MIKGGRSSLGGTGGALARAGTGTTAADGEGAPLGFGGTSRPTVDEAMSSRRDVAASSL